MDMIGIDHAYIVKHFQLNNFLNIGFAYAYNWVNSIWLCRYDAWSPIALQLERTHFFLQRIRLEYALKSCDYGCIPLYDVMMMNIYTHVIFV